jgi:hypothetical protein
LKCGEFGGALGPARDPAGPRNPLPTPFEQFPESSLPAPSRTTLTPHPPLHTHNNTPNPLIQEMRRVMRDMDRLMGGALAAPSAALALPAGAAPGLQV